MLKWVLEYKDLLFLLKTRLHISNFNSSIALFNKIIVNINYRFNIINKNNIKYVISFNNADQTYIILKYKYINLNIFN